MAARPREAAQKSQRLRLLALLRVAAVPYIGHVQPLKHANGRCGRAIIFSSRFAGAFLYHGAYVIVKGPMKPMAVSETHKGSASSVTSGSSGSNNPSGDTRNGRHGIG